MIPDQIEELGIALARCRQHGTVSPLRLDRIASPRMPRRSRRRPSKHTTASAAVMPFTQRQPCHSACCAATSRSSVLSLYSDLTLSGNLFRLPYGVLGAGCALALRLRRVLPLGRRGDLLRNGIARPRRGLLAGSRSPRPGVSPGSVPLNAFTATADFGLEVVHVHGPFVEHWDSLDLASARGLVRLNGDPLASGCFGDVLGHPMEAIVWLARLLKARGQELDAGDIVSTGTCTGLLQVVPGQIFEAKFDGLGSVKVSFE